MSSSGHSRLGAGYTITSVPWGDTGRQRQVARYECDVCEATIDYFPRANTLRSTDVHRKWLRDKGWLLNGHADKATCPRCQKGGVKATISDILQQAPKSDASPVAMALRRASSQKETPETIEGQQAVEWWTRPVRVVRPKAIAEVWPVASDPPETVPEPAPQEPEAPPPPPEPAEASAAPIVETPTEAPAPDIPELTVAPPAPPTIPIPLAPTVAPTSTRPSSDQRLKIRFALDQHFDDKLGEYLGDESDQSIADSIGVPIAWVETIREVAYAPLIRTAAMKRHAAEMTAIKGVIADIRTQLDAAMERLAKLEGA